MWESLNFSFHFLHFGVSKNVGLSIELVTIVAAIHKSIWTKMRIIVNLIGHNGKKENNIYQLRYITFYMLVSNLFNGVKWEFTLLTWFYLESFLLFDIRVLLYILCLYFWLKLIRNALNMYQQLQQPPLLQRHQQQLLSRLLQQRPLRQRQLQQHQLLKQRVQIQQLQRAQELLPEQIPRRQQSYRQEHNQLHQHPRQQ